MRVFLHSLHRVAFIMTLPFRSNLFLVGYVFPDHRQIDLDWDYRTERPFYRHAGKELQKRLLRFERHPQEELDDDVRTWSGGRLFSSATIETDQLLIGPIMETGSQFLKVVRIYGRRIEAVREEMVRRFS